MPACRWTTTATRPGLALQPEGRPLSRQRSHDGVKLRTWGGGGREGRCGANPQQHSPRAEWGAPSRELRAERSARLGPGLERSGEGVPSSQPESRRRGAPRHGAG